MQGWMWVYYEGGPKDGAESRLKLVFTGPYFRFDDPTQPDAWYRLTGRYRETSGRGIPIAEYVANFAEPAIMEDWRPDRRRNFHDGG